MSTFKARGIVLKETAVGEADKIVVLLLKEQGRVSASARGARKPKSKFMAATQLFTYSDFVIYNGGGFLSITQADIIENFYGISGSYEKLCLGSYFMELVEKTILESMPCDEILLLLLRTLAVLSKERVELRLLRRIFEFKYLQFLGYAPEMERCCFCRTSAPDAGASRAKSEHQDLARPAHATGDMYFWSEGYVCRNCLNSATHVTKISYAAGYAVRYVLNAGRELFAFNVNDEVLRELERAADIFMKSHIETSFKSRELL